MHNKNFPPLVISIIRDLLFDRSFQVQINEILSVRKQVEDGLPQGTVIRPLLFTLYISELKLRSQSKHEEFADDLLVWNRHKNITLLQNIIQEDIYDVYLFSKAFGLSISIPKTKAIVFHKRQITLPKPLRIEESEIVYEPSVRLLGMILDSILKWQTIFNDAKNDNFKTANHPQTTYRI